MATNPNWSWDQNRAAQPSIPPTQPPLGQPWSPPAGPNPPTGPPKPPTYTHNYGTRFKDKKRGGVLPGPTHTTSAVMVDTRHRSRSAPPRITTKNVPKGSRSKTGSGKKRKTRRNKRTRKH